MHHRQVWHGKPNILIYISYTSHKVFSCEDKYIGSSYIIQLAEERNYNVPCDSHKRKKYVNMKMVDATAKQNVEDRVSNIMEDMFGTETKPWYRKIRGYFRESCHMC